MTPPSPWIGSSRKPAVFGFRAALLGRISYIDQPLVNYTVEEGLSTRIDSGKGTREQRLAARAAGCDKLATVLEQRAEDLEAVAERLDPSTLQSLRQRLRQESHAIRVRQAFYRSDRSVLAELGPGLNWRVIRGLGAESLLWLRTRF
mgnify:CR=1 FL=1